MTENTTNPNKMNPTELGLSKNRLCILPELSGVGGMVTFQQQLKGRLETLGIGVIHDPSQLDFDALLVVGGTRRVVDLYRVQRAGIPIIQRLDGINWIHRKRYSGLRHFLRAEWGNWLMSTIRTRFTSRVVYQSKFVQSWWEDTYGPTGAPSEVIYNGVDLVRFSPGGGELRPDDRWVILVVEGRLAGGYELGLEHALELCREVAMIVARPVQLSVVGRAEQSLIDQYSDHPEVEIRWFGLISHEQVPLVDRSAHILFAADIHPACPNSVLEALACGTPVVAFDTGAIPELVTDSAGRVIPYGADPWQLESPDFSTLAEAAVQVLRNQKDFRAGARRRAEEAFSLDLMVQQYVRALGLTT